MPAKFDIPEIPQLPDIDAILRAPAPRPKPKPSVVAPTKTTEPERPIDPEADSRAELNELQRGFAARAKAEEARRTLATDSEYWVCLCFQTREQVEAFLAESGWGAKTDKYLDGRRVARELEISLPPDPTYPQVRKIDKSYSSLVE